MKKVGVVNTLGTEKYSVSLFEDDTIDVVRQRISEAVGRHPNRLFILVKLKLPKDYYANDPRHLESLFNRLSLDKNVIDKDIFELYQQKYITPPTSILYNEYEKSEWMSIPESISELINRDSDFEEFRIFGVEEEKSFVLPLDSKNSVSISSTRLPIPLLETLFSSLYDIKQLVGFSVLEHTDDFNNSLVYFPFLTSETPQQLTQELINLLNKNTSLLDKLLKLDVPNPTSISILRTRFYIPWVSTDFGSAVYSRFEQIFYGLTVSEATPYICFFTSKDQINRHKFYVEDAKTKKPIVDMTVWNSWWSLTKPSRERPTLLLYRGTSKHNFDRIAITSIDMVVSTHRDESSESTEELKKSLLSWIESLDSFIPFINKSDIDFKRWELQDINYSAKYDKKLKDFNLLRMNCISSLFNISDKTKSEFTMLRTDRDMGGLTAIDVKLIAMSKEGNIRPEDVAKDLSVSTQVAAKLIGDFRRRIDENPKLLNKSIRKFPNINIGETIIVVSFVDNLDLSLKYANLLRFILSEPDNEELDEICPKRPERVEAKTIIAVADKESLNEEIMDFSEFDLGDTAEPEIEPEVEEISKISTSKKTATTYKYFKSRLEKAYPDMFEEHSDYPKNCEKNRQPIVLSDADIRKLPAKYNIERYGKNKTIIIDNPKGTVVCPEYWCTRDEIPLLESDLIKDGDKVLCPVCEGKLSTKSTDNPIDFPLLKRDAGFVYPGFFKDTKFPCCYKTPTSIKNLTEKTGEYYIVGETKVPLEEFRLSYLPASLINSLKIEENYSLYTPQSRRIQSGNSGFYRVGLGHSSKTLPKFLNLKTTIIPPHESVKRVLQCSFLKTWNTYGTTHIETIKTQLKSLLPDISIDKLSKIISGISEAFINKTLSPLHELEYSTNSLQCDVFQIDMKKETLSCMFYAPLTYSRKRAIIVLQNDEYLDILSFVQREQSTMKFIANVYEKNTPFKKETYVELEKMRNEACKTSLPSYSDALNVMQVLLEKLQTTYSIILDPYGMGQAFYIPNEVILPFQSTNLPDVVQAKIDDFKDVDSPPTYDKVIAYLEQAQRINNGYKFKEDLFSTTHKVEIMTESGLRIPIVPIPIDYHESTEVIETVKAIGEGELVFGDESTELRETHSKISYSAEVYEFLLFQLAYDIEHEYIDLYEKLQSPTLTAKILEPELKKWFDHAIKISDIKTPTKFISKIRTPCGQFKSEKSCSGNLCGWDSSDGKCTIQLKPSINIPHLFNRIMTTLIDNTKIRSMIIDGRITPFFSTILYLELPHELIVTDSNLP